MTIRTRCEHADDSDYRYRPGEWSAWFHNGPPGSGGAFAVGSSEAEAVGALVMGHPEVLGATVVCLSDGVK